MKLLRQIAFIVLTLVTLTPPLTAKLERLEAPVPGRGTIGVRIGAFFGKVRESADTVYFVRMSEGAQSDEAAGLIPSNFGKARSVYLLNARPGRYIAVAAEIVRSMPTTRTVVVFTKADSALTEVEVKAGTVVFMGDIDVVTSMKSRDLDQDQAHTLDTIMATSSRLGVMDRALGADFAYPATFKGVDRGDDVELDFWSSATHNHFRGEEAWVSLIEHRPVLRAPVTASTKP
jgi:hypothetical protein